jgi:predicted DCC family thiol-disulfide oxidoreductase YuxK
MNTLKNAWNWLSEHPHQRRGLRYLQVAMGILLAFRSFTELPFAEYLYGANGLGTGDAHGLLGPDLGNLLAKCFVVHGMPYVTLLAQGLCGLALIFGFQTRLATFAGLVIFDLVNNRMPQIGDGGDNITQLLLIYTLFALPARATPKPHSLSVWMHNVAVLVIGFQICDLYFTSGTAKMAGDKWFHGVAMFYISQVEWFSEPWMRGMFRNPFIVLGSTYIPMFYQVLFPIAIFSRLKMPWLITGIIFHLGIAVFMGLVTFSSIMIGLELFIITDDEYAKLEGYVTAFLDGTLLGLRSQRLSARPALRIYLDGGCAGCCHAARLFDRLDWRALVETASYRSDRSYTDFGLEESDIRSSLIVVDLKSGRVCRDMEALRALAGRLPLLTPLVPVLIAAKALRMNRLLRWLLCGTVVMPIHSLCEQTEPVIREEALAQSS